MNLRFERLSDDNLHHLVSLFQAVYKKKLPVSYFRQKYDTAFLKPPKYGYFAFDRDIPVAFSGMIPYLMEYEGKQELSVQTCDSMTHPSYGRMGLFKTVAEKSYKDLKADGISFIWSFPNEASVGAATKKLNWQLTPEMTGYRIPIMNKYAGYAIRKANEIFYGNNSLQKIFEQELTEQFPEHSLKGCGYVTTVRNRDFYKYKTFAGNLFVKICGIKIWLKQNGSLFVGDMDNITADELQTVIIELKKKAIVCGATDIYFQSHSGSEIQNSFHSLYPNFSTWKLVYHPLNTSFPIDKIRVTMGDLDSF